MSTSNITLNDLPRKSKKSKRTVTTFAMTVIAVVFTLMPLFTVGIWVSQFFGSRGTTPSTQQRSQ